LQRGITDKKMIIRNIKKNKKQKEEEPTQISNINKAIIKNGKIRQPN